MKKALLLLTVVLLVGCAGSNFEQKQYYKDDTRNRIFCVYTQEKDSLELLNYGKQQMFTPNRQTRVYFFDNLEDIPTIEIRNDLLFVFGILYDNGKAFAMYENNDRYEGLMFKPFAIKDLIID